MAPVLATTFCGDLFGNQGKPLVGWRRPPAFGSSSWRELAETGELLVATHMPFPSVGRVAIDGDAFRWVPTFWDY